MNRNLLSIVVCLLAGIASATAQDSLKIHIGADLVSRYVWRGIDSGTGFSLQPSLSFDFRGFSLGAWSNESLTHMDTKEVDISLAYTVGGLTATLTDYFWAGEDKRYSSYRDDHYGELELAYAFEPFPLTISWATMLWAGEADELDEDNNRMFSSYFNLAYDFDVYGVDLTPSIGFTPWKGQFADKFNVMDICLTASKDLPLSDRFSLPIFSQLIVSPACQRTYLVFGLSLQF